jgi:hypothetical protein
VPDDREPNRSRKVRRSRPLSSTSERMIFPFVGVLTGLTAFAVPYFLWPAGVPLPMVGRRSTSTQKVLSGGVTSGSGVRNLKLTGQDGSVHVTWAAPSGASVDAYSVEAVPEDPTLPTRICSAHADSRALECTVGELANGVRYTIEVRSQSASGAKSAPQRAQVVPHPGILTSDASALWLDADDVAGAPGSPVHEWDDRSGRAIVATQPSSAAQPVVEQLGNHRALKFSGSQNLIFNGSKLPSGSATSTTFVVVRLDDSKAATSCFGHVLAWGAARTGGARMIHKGCSTAMAYAETYDSASAMQPTRTWPVGQMSMLAASIGKSGVKVRMNGEPDYSWKPPSKTSINTVAQKPAMVGGAPWWGVRNGWVGLIGEVIVLSGRVSTTDSQAVEQYLIRKWHLS